MVKSSGGIFHSENVSVFLSELLGTALLVFFGCSGCLSWKGDVPPNELQVVLTFGIAVLICIQIFGCVSGAHINPSVTVAALIYKLISVKTAIAYIIAQCLGAFMGYGLLITLTPANTLEISGDAVCVTRPHAWVSIPQAFFIEFIATATLIWFCCGIWDPRNAKSHDSIPLRFGLAIAGLASATGNFTGGSFNPARSLGPAIWTGHYESHWIYWFAPLSGAIVSTLIYKHVFHREVIETQNGHQLDTFSENDKV